MPYWQIMVADRSRASSSSATAGRIAASIPCPSRRRIADAKAPVATIGVGSIEPRRNVRIQELIAPSRAYPEDKTVIRAIVQGESYRGRTVTVELLAREGTPDAAAVKVGEAQATFDADAAMVEVEFDLEPAAVGRLELEARVAAPPDDQYSDDNRRTAEMEIVDSNTRVLLLASGATRDYRFLRNQLRRDRHVTVDVLLQGAPAGISQDADTILANFPTSKEDLFKYDCIVAFDPDWLRLDAKQIDLLEEWVDREAGGMIVVAGPINTQAWLQSPLHNKMRALYPVEFEQRLTLFDDGLFGSQKPWPIEFTREGQEADFLWLGDTPQESRVNWQKFPGVFGCFAVRGPKPGAQVYGRYSDPDAGLVAGLPVYFADHFYGAGRVFYMGSGELWRLRAVDPALFRSALHTAYPPRERRPAAPRLVLWPPAGGTRPLLRRRHGDRTSAAQHGEPRAVPRQESDGARAAPHPGGRRRPANDASTNVDLVADESRPGTLSASSPSHRKVRIASN